jgi:hypothetical protein
VVRDEGANLGWAIEIRAASPGGFPVDRSALPAGSSGQPALANNGQLGLSLPAAHSDSRPLAGANPGHFRRRRQSVRARHTHPYRHHTARSNPLGSAARRARQLWRPSAPARAHLGEGASPRWRLDHPAWQCTRWTDGSQHAWIGRRKQSNNGVAAAGCDWTTLRLKARTQQDRRLFRNFSLLV